MNFTFSNIQSKEMPTPESKTVNGRGYVYWGKDNRYTKFLYSLYQNSSIVHSIIDSITDYVIGDGVQLVYNTPDVPSEISKFVSNDSMNDEGDALSDIIRRCVTDYEIFGAFAIQVLRNQLGEISELYWLDIRKVRLGEHKDKIYYSDWDKTKPRTSTTNAIIEYEMFDPKNPVPDSVFYATNRTDRDIYPTPSWIGAINAASTDVEISKFHLHSILNNFAPSAIVNFNNGVPSKEEQDEIEDALNRKFSGSENASKMMLVWNESANNAVTVERLGEDNFDQKYQALSESIQQNLFTAFRINPILCGINVQTGFSKQEFKEAFELANKTVISPIQSLIEKSFAKLFGNDYIEFKPFELSDDKNTTEENQ